MIKGIRKAVRAVRLVVDAVNESMLNEEGQESVAALKMMEWLLDRLDTMAETMSKRRERLADAEKRLYEYSSMSIADYVQAMAAWKERTEVAEAALEEYHKDSEVRARTVFMDAYVMLWEARSIEKMSVPAGKTLLMRMAYDAWNKYKEEHYD